MKILEKLRILMKYVGSIYSHFKYSNIESRKDMTEEF